MPAVNPVVDQNDAPITVASTFVITNRDVGTQAVRPGCMADLEQRHQVLLLAAKLVLKRMRDCEVSVGAAHEFALDMAIRTSEQPF